MKELLTTKLSKKDERFLRLAMKIAGDSSETQKHGAVLVSSGRVLGLGVNSRRNSGAGILSGDYTIHAELSAMGRYVSSMGGTIYVARVDKNGNAQYSRPCDSCMKAMRHRGVKKVVYSLNGIPAI